ncbi:lipopolysaccharide biosynthesis protein [Wenyingzhuangia sp. IMCC45467]
MSSIVKNTFIYTIGRVLPQITGFVLLPLYTKYLSPAEYGIVESMLALGMVLTIFFSMATERSMFRLYYDYSSLFKKKIFIANISFLIFLFSSIVLLLLFVLKDYVELIYTSISFTPYYVYAIINAYFMAFAFIPQTMYQVQEKALKFLLITISSFFIGIVFILYYVVVLNQGAEGLLKGKMIGNLVMLPVYIYLIYKNSVFRISKKVLKNIISFSLPMVPTLLTAWVLNMSNRIFIERYFTLDDVGIFSMAYRISSLVGMLLGAVFTAYNPVFYRLANNKNEDQVVSKAKIADLNHLILTLSIIICFGLSFFSKELVYFLLDEKYSESAYLIPVITLSNMLIQVAAFYNLMIYQSKKSVLIMTVSIIGAICSIGFNYLLVPMLGAYGAAWAAVLSAIVLLLLKIYYASKNYYVKIDYKVFISVLFFLGTLIFVEINYLSIDMLTLLIIKILLCLIVLIVFYKKNSSKLNSLIKT